MYKISINIKSYYLYEFDIICYKQEKYKAIYCHKKIEYCLTVRKHDQICGKFESL